MPYFLDLHNDKVMSVVCWCAAGQLVSTMANMEGEESFEVTLLGQAEEVVIERICDDELILIKG